MKTKSKIAGTIILVFGLIILGCHKEEFENVSQPNSTNDSPKTNFSNLEILGMAANIKKITYISGQYFVSFYGSSDAYSVAINTFKLDSLIDLGISDNNNSHRSIVDVNKDSLSIFGGYSYSFSDLQNIQIESSSDILLRITLAVIAQHNENPRSSIVFSNNGNSDYFPDNAARKCFWCKRVVTNEYFPGLCVDITTTTMFWIFEHEDVSDTYAC